MIRRKWEDRSLLSIRSKKLGVALAIEAAAGTGDWSGTYMRKLRAEIEAAIGESIG